MKKNIKFKTADLCDQYSDELIIIDQKFKSYGKESSFYGKISTVKCLNDNSKVKEVLSTNGCNKVLVVDGNGSTDCALLGDMLAEAAFMNNWSGIIINGCIRDSDVIAGISVGVFALSTIPIKSVKKGIGDVDIDISFMDVTFKPGHYIYADLDGIIISKKELSIN
tara:strand:- start:512 stop:1009 length:498 start_codon:yes stop_codon:yes gene_type:complete